MLLKALEDNVKKFESRFGEIKIDQQFNPAVGFPAVNKNEKVN